MNITIPIDINKKNGEFEKYDKVEKSIDAFLKLMTTTSRRSCVCDPDFGFVFSNFKFEIFNELDGIVNYEPTTTEESQEELEMYTKKISGTSKNVNTFAKEFQDLVERYEKRLTDVTVSMAYIREQKLIFLTVTGTIKKSKKNYSFTTTINVWNH